MDIERYKTIDGTIEDKINIERSIFITTLRGIEDEYEAKNFISEMNKKYANATHNCLAYRLIGKQGIIEFSSDMGEPSGTAGVPMLNSLRKAELLNVAVVVTRYFGGVKLGIRGLIDAYSQSVERAIEKAQSLKSILVKRKAFKQKLKIDFVSYGKKMQQLSYKGVTILDISYSEEYAFVEVICNKPLDFPEIVESEIIYIADI
ncbi:MAG TPA: YigZ family protein [Fervidobacterium sp.]|nr:YigZ family protein [Fervidobacterium sp.]HPT54186.1 YigZ family protein [Fervidobacterium sp.]HPZ18396.1 YigZ family protein [Fervidobacterium sp.]HQE49692.1 YigZ family protein [Fervidobacterium sp.]HUM43377.1 YigZ family protein [Fervidobacterium sp.]